MRCPAVDLGGPWETLCMLCRQDLLACIDVWPERQRSDLSCETVVLLAHVRIYLVGRPEADDP